MAQAQCPVDLRSTAEVEPFTFFEAMRSTGDVVWDESMRSWIVLDYANCRYVEDNEDAFPNAYREPNPLFIKIKGGENISTMQDEEHRRIRHLHLQLLSPVATKGYRNDFILPILEHLIEPIIDRGHADLAKDFGDQLPPRLTAALFGMPWKDDALVHDLLHLNDTVMTWIGMRATGDKSYEDKARAASEQLNALILPYIHLRRREPAGDFVSRLLAELPTYSGSMSDQDIIATCRELLLAASDTTIHAIANALYVVFTKPEIRSALEMDLDGQLDALVEEALRIYGSVQYQVRYAAADCKVGGVAIAKGDSIILHHAAANLDPTIYPRPYDADFSRKPLKRHLAFGIGPRACPGAGLARLEIKEAVRIVLTRLPSIRLDPDAPPPAFGGFFTRSWRPLNVVFGC